MITLFGHFGDVMGCSSIAANQQVSWQERFFATPVRELTFVAFDTEATGRHPLISGLVEIAGVKFRGSGELLESRTQLINPGRLIPSVVSEIHGITDAMVAEQPGQDQVIPPFIEWMQRDPSGVINGSAPVVFLAHNASFDVSFLQVALTRLSIELPANPVLDTLLLARYFVKDSKNHRLRTLIEHFGHGDEALYHRADADSRHVVKLFLELIRLAGDKCTLSELIEAAGVMYFSKPFELVEDPFSASDLRVHRIGEAISRGADLEIHYKGHGAKIRRVTPHTLIYSGKKYYLSAYCHAMGHERTFKINRISELELVRSVEAES